MLSLPDSVRPFIERHRGERRVAGDGFVQSIQEDFDEIAPHLPLVVTTILDIGCGMAGIDILLKRRFPEAELWLLDGDGNDPRAGWNERLEAFSSRAAAEEFLALNGVSVDRWLDVNTRLPMSADLVVSLASWGFHYPISTYDVSGFCVADLRKGKEPKRGVVINEYPKRFRCAWQNRGSL